MHVYSDRSSERHVNFMARVEAEERFPAALAGVEAAEKAGLPVEWHSRATVPEEFIAAIHSLSYTEHLQNLCMAGGGYLNADTGLGPDSWEAAARASGAAIGAVESALSGAPAFAVARPPGHHAGADYGMGFCLLNHAAVAAEYARSRGAEKVAILDWDVHHGNGTQDLFYADERVLYLSVHQSPFYPGTGSVREVGEGGGKGFTANVPFALGSSGEALCGGFRRGIPPGSAGVWAGSHPGLRRIRCPLRRPDRRYEARNRNVRTFRRSYRGPRPRVGGRAAGVDPGRWLQSRRPF